MDTMQNRIKILNEDLIYPRLETIYTDNSDRELWTSVGNYQETDYAVLSDVVSINPGFITDKIYILKHLPFSITTRKVILNEIDVQIKAAALGVAPKIIDAWFSADGGVFVMEKLNTNVGTLFVEFESLAVKHLILASIMSLIGKLHLHNIYHGDVHFGNIMAISGDPSPTYKPNPNIRGLVENGSEESFAYALKRYKFYFIDFGQGGYLKGDREVDVESIRFDYVRLDESLYDLLNDCYTPALRNVYDTLELFMTKFD